jgi:hypothetical protein
VPKDEKRKEQKNMETLHDDNVIVVATVDHYTLNYASVA